MSGKKNKSKKSLNALEVAKGIRKPAMPRPIVHKDKKMKSKSRNSRMGKNIKNFIDNDD